MERTKIITDIFCNAFSLDIENSTEEELKNKVSVCGKIANMIIDNQLDYENSIVTQEDDLLIEQIQRQRSNSMTTQEEEIPYIEDYEE
jgi:hypothetical protein